MFNPHRHTQRIFIASLVLTVSLPTSAADLAIDPARVQAVAALLPPKPAGLGRPITDRAAWEALSKQPGAGEIIKQAEALLAEPLPATSDELYLDYSRTGNRTRWQDLNFKRRGRITTLTLAECLEHKGRFLAALKEVVESVCAERTWIMPAHDARQSNFEGQAVDIDLGSAGLGWTLATMDWLLGDALSGDTRGLVRERLSQRIFEPFKDMATGQRPPNNWLTVTNNWNAVCLAGVAGAALATIDGREERAFFVAAAEKYSRSFLEGFTSDGYCSEGVGYWNYGFGHYLMLAETIHQATGGGVDLLALDTPPRAAPGDRGAIGPPAADAARQGLAGEKARAAALYGLRIEIVPGVCPAFADCDVRAQPGGRYLWYIGRKWRLGLPEEESGHPDWSRATLFEAVMFGFENSASRLPSPARRWEGPGPRTWFEQAGVYIGRPVGDHMGRLAVALKGGHNAEHHNHNDVGSYLVVAGGRPVLVDPGAEVYTARTFGGRRYDSQVLNSFGHPVPRVAGQLQQTGGRARGRVLRTDFTDAADTLAFDIRSAYKAPELERLERTFVYSRGGAGKLTVADAFAFKTPESFGTALITFGQWRETAPGRLRIEDGDAAVEVAIAATGGRVELKAEPIREDLTAKRTPTRIGIDFVQPVENGRVEVTITPAGK